jgi:hypothetical protein
MDKQTIKCLECETEFQYVPDSFTIPAALPRSDKEEVIYLTCPKGHINRYLLDDNGYVIAQSKDE